MVHITVVVNTFEVAEPEDSKQEVEQQAEDEEVEHFRSRFNNAGDCYLKLFRSGNYS